MKVKCLIAERSEFGAKIGVQRADDRLVFAFVDMGLHPRDDGTLRLDDFGVYSFYRRFAANLRIGRNKLNRYPGIQIGTEIDWGFRWEGPKYLIVKRWVGYWTATFALSFDRRKKNA